MFFDVNYLWSKFFLRRTFFHLIQFILFFKHSFSFSWIFTVAFLKTYPLALQQSLQMVRYVHLLTIFINAIKDTLTVTFCLEIFPFDVLLLVCENNTDLIKSSRGFICSKFEGTGYHLNSSTFDMLQTSSAN